MSETSFINLAIILPKNFKGSGMETRSHKGCVIDAFKYSEKIKTFNNQQKIQKDFKKGEVFFTKLYFGSITYCLFYES